jgi:AcrR family transcriptional regulator
MTTQGQTSSVRDAHKELTRERILDAAIDLLNTGDMEQLTNANVAKAAGVTERTVYRHFASREELLRDAWAQLQKRVGTGGFIQSADDLVNMPPRLFSSFDTMPGAVRASAFSPAGREMRLAVNAERQQAFLKAVKEARPDLKGEALIRMTAICQLICSAWSWSIMRDYWNLDAKQSGRAASEAIAVLLGVDPETGPAPSPNVVRNTKKKP